MVTYQQGDGLWRPVCGVAKVVSRGDLEAHEIGAKESRLDGGGGIMSVLKDSWR